MHLGMPECNKPFLGHCDLDLWPSFQELLCPEHISYIIWCRNPKFGVVIPLGMAVWCIQFWVILTLTLTSGFISRFFLLYYSYLSSNVSCARPIPLGAFVTCLWHFLFRGGPDPLPPPPPPPLDPPMLLHVICGSYRIILHVFLWPVESVN